MELNMNRVNVLILCATLVFCMMIFAFATRYEISGHAVINRWTGNVVRYTLQDAQF